MVRKESADPKLAVSCGPHCRNTIMKLTKNAAALLLAASLAVSVCATPVFADTPPVTNGTTVQSTGENITAPTEEKQACTKLSYQVTAGYTWSIPADIDFGKDSGVNKDVVPTGTPKTTVMVSDCKINNGKTLHIDMKGNGGGDKKITSGNGEFKIASDENETLVYEVKAGDSETEINTTVNSGDDVLKLEAGKEKITKYLSFTLKTVRSAENVSEKAGSYYGYAIFTAQLKDTTTSGT